MYCYSAKHAALSSKRKEYLRMRIMCVSVRRKNKNKLPPGQNYVS